MLFRSRIDIDGFYDDVLDWDDETRDSIRNLPFDEEEFAKSIGTTLAGAEKAYSVNERLWTRPACDVNGILSGYTGEGAKTVLPANAMAKVSFRLVADQNPQRVFDLMRAHVAKVAPEGVTVRVEELHSGMPWRAQLSGKLKEAATTALIKAFGVAPVLAGEGEDAGSVSAPKAEAPKPAAPKAEAAPAPAPTPAPAPAGPGPPRSPPESGPGYPPRLRTPAPRSMGPRGPALASTSSPPPRTLQSCRRHPLRWLSAMPTAVHSGSHHHRPGVPPEQRRGRGPRTCDSVS